MGEGLLYELKKALKLVESLKGEVYGVGGKENFRAASGHIDNAILESEEAVKEVVEKLELAISNIKESLNILESKNCESEKLERNLTSSLEILIQVLGHLEFQDIMAQRLLKVKGFINDIERILRKIFSLIGDEEISDNRTVENLTWDREVSQSDVDEMLKQMDGLEHNNES